MMPLIRGSLFRRSTSARTSSSVVSAGRSTRSEWIPASAHAFCFIPT
jgi:hypothetical protein